MLHLSDLKNIWNKHWFYVLIFVYLLTRFINLTDLPIFNDEAIYIDWGNKIKLGVVPLFYSLYDGKPPLHFVLLSLILRFFWDPLLAGRLLSVISGLLTIIALKMISSEYFEKRYQYLPILLYVFSPMFLFYDRQSLQESLITAQISWLIYLLLKYFKKFQIKHIVIFSVILASAFMTKVSTLVLLPSVTIIFAYSFVKNKERRNTMFVSLIIIIFVFLILNIPLLSQKDVGLMFSRNDRYALTLGDLGFMTFKIWGSNIIKTFQIYFWYFNTLLLSLIGYLLVKKKVSINKHIVLLSFVIPIILLIFSSRGLIDRYLVPFSIPIIFILSGGLILLIRKIGRLALVILTIPFLMSVFQIFNVDKYLMIMNKYAKGLDMSVYISGFTSGYGVDGAIEYIKSESTMHDRIFVGVRLDAGNPESAIMAYFFKKGNLKIIPVYFDQLITIQPLGENFFGNYYPFYFVSRDDNLGGMNKYLMEIKRYYKPDDKSFVGIYKYVQNK